MMAFSSSSPIDTGNKPDAKMYLTPQWIQNLDPKKPHHARALKSFRHQSCRLSNKSCTFCSRMNVACFVASAISVCCVKCTASGLGGQGKRRCDVNSSDTNDDDGVLVDVNPLRGNESPRSDITSAAANTMKPHAEKPKHPLKSSRKLIKTSELPAIVSASASVPRRNATSEKESSGIQQESRPSIHTKANDKPDTLVSVSPKRRRLEPNTTSEAAKKEGQPLNAAEPSSAQSSPFPTPFTNSPNLNRQSSSMHESPLPSTPGMSIDAKKQNNTTLWISIPFSSDAVPLKLRSCITTSSLFDSVLTICGLTEQQAKVLGLRTTLGWKQNVDVQKSLVVKREFEDSFEIFLEIIDSSPCWEKEGGRCVVVVEVVMA